MLAVVRHPVEYLADKLERHLFVEQVTHAVDENELGRTPLARSVKVIGMQLDCRFAREKRTATLESKGDGLRVAVGAPGADLGCSQ
jgi:hypothetical protein